MTRGVGISGTREGFKTVSQKHAFYRIFHVLTNQYGLEVHHGDCIGVDEAVHNYCDKLSYTIIVHPPVNPKNRAFCKPAFGSIRDPLPYLERNKFIVDETSVLLAAPKGMVPDIRSGTWHAIRHAREKGKSIYVIKPNGEVDREIQC